MRTVDLLYAVYERGIAMAFPKSPFVTRTLKLTTTDA